MFSKRALFVGVGTASVAVAGMIGCVGDDASTTPSSPTDDGGGDTAAPGPDASEAATDAGPVGRCDPTKPFGAPTPVTELNGMYDDSSPHLSWDELTIYFSRRATSDSDPFQIWYARRSSRSDPFDPPMPLPKLGTPDGGTDLQPMISKNDLALYFTSDRNPGMTFDLFTATRAAGGSPATNPFGNVVPLASLNHASTSESRPFLSADATELWFTANAQSGDPVQIYRALAPFTSAEVATDLSTAGENASPTLSADGLTMYFASDRPGGAGKDDIWFAKRTSANAAFQAAVSLSTVNTLFNSDQSDVPGWVSPDDCAFWMASERNGNLDIYLAMRPK